MKLLSTLLSFAAMTAAIVFPDPQVLERIAIKTKPQSSLNKPRIFGEETWFDVPDSFQDSIASGENALGNPFSWAPLVANKKSTAKFECHESLTAFDAQAWLDSAMENVEIEETEHPFDPRPSDPNSPLYPPPVHGPRPKRPEPLVRRPARPNPDHEPNLTVYELIANSKVTTEFAKLINRYPDLVELLNGTASTYTIFAPVNKAFEKISGNVKEPSTEAIRKMLNYHIVPLQFDAYSVFMAHTIPTILAEDVLGGQAQRLRVDFGFDGWKINYYSKIISGNFVSLNLRGSSFQPLFNVPSNPLP
jgi:hypothetical protein